MGEGRRYDHMTTNLVVCMNSMLKGARSLPFSHVLKTTFKSTKTWFIERGLKTSSRLRPCHKYPKDIIALLQQNQQK